MIQCRGLGKDFKHYQKAAGFAGSLKQLVRRDYQLRAAVTHFDLEINPGEMVGLLGPNGAGKTTLMKMFSGIIVPSHGELRVHGHVPFVREQVFRRKIALVMGQKSQLWWDIPAMDSFLLLQKYYEIDDTAFKKRLSELSALLGVERQMQVHVRKLSLGERMKMELMACLLHRPDILFLDEPTIGLDVVAQRSIRDFIAQYQAQHKTTVILTSHYMADVEALCQRIVLVLGGEKRFDGPIGEFSSILGLEKFVTIAFSASIPTEAANYFKDFDPHWNDARTRVDLRIAEGDVRRRAIEILECFPVIEFSMEKLPIERVMNELLINPHLLKGAAQ
ncbi:MAG: ATP-binding cassette domain-containing protein [Deltaproteobacteria bacterium]|nr:ATP-binding cassette domain-containing protein [Deltaproteobacteria bacterium]